MKEEVTEGRKEKKNEGKGESERRNEKKKIN